MNIKTTLKISLVVYVIICAGLVIQTGLFDGQASNQSSPFISLASTATNPVEGMELPERTDEIDAVVTELLESDSPFDPVLGSEVKDSGYKFKLVLTPKGAAIKRAVLSEYEDRDHKNPKPLEVLKPIQTVNRKIYTLANSNLDVPSLGKRYPLDQLDWEPSSVVTEENGNQTVKFSLTLQNNGIDTLKLVKTYSIEKDSYDIKCDLQIENLTDEQIITKINMQGPAGISRESYRDDGRDIISAYQIEGSINTIKKPARNLRNATKKGDYEKFIISHKKAGNTPIWAGTTNKYFAALVRVVPASGDELAESFVLENAEYYDEDAATVKTLNGNENISYKFLLKEAEINSNDSYSVSMVAFVGPKDKKMFDKNELYKKLEFFQTINFRSCFCCPSSIIEPLAFGILGLMNFMYTIMGPLGNYGVVIMLLVFMMRLAMHPITKKSQVSMMGLQKLGPKMEEIRKKYSNNPREMQKRQSELYREAGVNPVMGILPMFIQMPIWMALWTAVYTSLDLRGAGFLPFWITDLSAPDSLIRFKAITLPLFGEIDSFNLLPILMGVVMFLQQKLMPQSSASQTNPQAAQQQKMMMIMMPLMFPLMLYKGPSGVNLYIMSSIGAGVIEQAVIRKHIREKEAKEAQGMVSVTKKTGGKIKKKKPKPFYKG